MQEGGLLGEDSLFQPGFLCDLALAGALRTLIAQERQDQVFKLSREAGGVRKTHLCILTFLISGVM